MVTSGAHALYTGRLRHRRVTPTPHAFTYSLFMALLDIDDLDAAMRVSPFTSRNRFNWAAFDDRDHVGDPSRPLRERLRSSAAEAGIALPGGRIRLLTHLRYLGYTFNPLSLYYCDDEHGVLHTIGAEVHSTFGEQRLYWMPAASGTRTGQGLHLRTPKTMHVSPFMGMHVDYEFVLTPPETSLVVHINTRPSNETASRPYFDATLTLERRPWTASTLHGALARHPAMTAKVIAAIHWEALRLWWKGLPSYPHPGRAAARGDRSTQEAEV